MILRAHSYLESPRPLVHALLTTTRDTREEHEVFLATVRALLETEKPS